MYKNRALGYNFDVNEANTYGEINTSPCLLAELHQLLYVNKEMKILTRKVIKFYY